MHGSLIPKKNVNPGSSCGCFSETACDRPHHTSELCCTADMMELAAHLARCASLHSRWAELADHWDEVERFVRNEVLKTQLTNPARIEKKVICSSAVSPKEISSCLRSQQGIWIFGRPFLHDLLRYQLPGTIHTAAWLENNASSTDTSSGIPVPVLRSGGCCAYSGPRALYTAWANAVFSCGDIVEVRMPISWKDASIEISVLKDIAGLRLDAVASRIVHLRIPRYVEKGSVEIKASTDVLDISWSNDDRWLTLSLSPGQEALITWRLREWSVSETFGPCNELGVVDGVAADGRVACTLHYRGAEVIGIEPEGAGFSYAEGL